MRSFLVAFCFLMFSASSAFAAGNDALKAFFLSGDYRSCVNEGKKLVSLPEPEEETFYLAGLSCLKCGDFSVAAEMFEAQLRNFRRGKYSDEARLGLADSRYLSGDAHSARELYLKFLSSRPSSKLKPGVYYRLYLIEGRIGSQSEAERYKSLLRSEFPGSPEAAMEKDIFPLARVIPVADKKAKPVVKAQVRQTKASSAKAQEPPCPRVKASEARVEQPLIIPAEDISDAPRNIYSIQVGAFSKRTNADRLAAKLKRQGYPAYLEQSLSAGNIIYKVKVGQFEYFPEARALERRLARDGYPTKLAP